MSPRKLATRPADKSWARSRRSVADKYYEVADLKPLAHYGESLLRAKHRDRALAAALALVEEARARTGVRS